MQKNKTLIKILIPICVLVVLAVGTALFFATSKHPTEDTTPTQGMNGSQIPNVSVDPTPSIPLEAPNENVYSGQVVSLTVHPIEDSAKRDAVATSKARYEMVINTTQDESGNWSNPIHVVYETDFNGSFGVCPGDTIYFSAVDNGECDLNVGRVKSVAVKTMSRINGTSMDNGVTRGIYADGYMDVDTTTGEEAYFIYLCNYSFDLTDVTITYTCYKGDIPVGSNQTKVTLSGGYYPKAVKVLCEKEYDKVIYGLEYNISTVKDEVSQKVVRESKALDNDYIRVYIHNTSDQKLNTDAYVIFFKDSRVIDIVLAGNNDWTGAVKPGAKQYLYAYYPQEYYDEYIVCYNCDFVK